MFAVLDSDEQSDSDAEKQEVPVRQDAERSSPDQMDKKKKKKNKKGKGKRDAEQEVSKLERQMLQDSSAKRPRTDDKNLRVADEDAELIDEEE